MYDIGINGLEDVDAFSRFIISYNNLKFRPDWDGYLTLEEANDWYRNGNGQPLYVSLDKVDLSGLTSRDIPEIGSEKLISLFGKSCKCLNDALVYGSITIEGHSNSITSKPDTYNVDMKPWQGIHNCGRNIGTIIGHVLAGSGIGYKIYFYGSKKLTPDLPCIRK